MNGRTAAAFAASCAERLLPLADGEPDGRAAAELTAAALERAWQIVVTGEGTPADFVVPLEALAREVRPPGVVPSFTTDAAVCVLYALRALGEVDPGSWASDAGARAHEVVDAIVQWRDGADPAEPGVEERLRRDALVSAELDKQARDRSALATRDPPEVVETVRAESIELGGRYAAEVAVARRRH